LLTWVAKVVSHRAVGVEVVEEQTSLTSSGSEHGTTIVTHVDVIDSITLAAH